MNIESLIFDRSYVNGEWTSKSKTYFNVTNPANGEIVGKVINEGKPMINFAIDAANEAFLLWSSLSAKSRSQFLEKWHDLILQYERELARIMTLESGKPIQESIGEVRYGAAFLKWFAEEGKRVYGDSIPSPHKDKRILILKQPIGVVGAITPWNFPLAMITRKVAPALASGCTIVVRPCEETPLTAFALAHLADLSGIPNGVLNVVAGLDADAMGRALCASILVKKISFTGSTRVGKLLMEQCSDTLKKLSLELGGNAPFIIFEDADIDAAVKGAIIAKYRNSGQTCVCVNRFLVHYKVLNVFTKKLIAAVEQLKVGNGLEKDINIGPMINDRAMEKTKSFVTDAIANGGNILLGGEQGKGNFYAPTIIGNGNTNMKLSREEIFGPVAALFSFSSEEEAIKMANDTVYGLACYFYSQNVSRCWRVAERLEYGMVGINEGIISTEVAPFGGIKQSGMGREGSKYGIGDYMEIKYLCFGNIQ